MKTENMNSKTYTSGKRAYIKPYVDIIKMDTSYGMMEDRSIPIDSKTPATGGGNAKRFEMDDNMWDDNFEGKK